MLDMKHDVMVRKMKDEDVIKKFKKEKCWGLCTCVDLKECNPETIRDPDAIRRFIIELCDLIEMKRFGDPTVIHFGPNERVAGYSMTQLIETSLISGHFANETNSAYLDIFSCKEYAPEKTAEFCKKFFGARTMNFNIMFRN
jgi:S-adenosylmethionine/arginine decarboxylase-like enzyme